MPPLPKPSQPLRILTLDGGGLQGISTLFILDQLLKTIAPNNGEARPCDVFDVIAGIGTGAGSPCCSVASTWTIAPSSMLQHRDFDTERLVAQVDQLAEFYESDMHMFAPFSEDVRCGHVFVSNLTTDSKGSELGYTLFRTYDWPKDVRLLDGPEPREYKISHAFAATGASKYFTPSWKEPSAKKGKRKFLDAHFPSPHNITELALDEIWALYGTDVEISVVVSIGPGLPSAADCRDFAQRFFWGKKVVTGFTAKRASDGNGVDAELNKVYEAPGQIPNDETEITHRVNFGSQVLKATAETDRNRPTTFASARNVDIQDQEDKIEDSIRKKLRNIYPNNPPPYYRLAPSVRSRDYFVPQSFVGIRNRVSPM
ncbi:hypothetical protein G7Y79_00060g092260 [Physcia stellaris]|nr:hypothetical protein G7Y79_00060g092260 [Physcia stellaris]